VNNWDLMFRALPGIPLIKPGDDLASIIVTAAQQEGFTFQENDIIVVASKIVSKAENRLVNLADVTPCERAKRLSERTGRDARLCQLYLDEAMAILNVKGRHVVTVDRRGFQGTGAGVDMSNIAPRSAGFAILLPEDPDACLSPLLIGPSLPDTDYDLRPGF
jgi:coenzyme F420-0:L-glutamate ligase / coenzyme F420-1:gamma-L-glutamate ligase